jgi:hypothetical protein
MKTTQLQFVREHLLRHGYITRNFCLQNYISRLGSRICDLKSEGLCITGENFKTENGTDYIYRLIKKEQGKLL